VWVGGWVRVIMILVLYLGERNTHLKAGLNKYALVYQ
jgi:hypothetical protein